MARKQWASTRFGEIKPQKLGRKSDEGAVQLAICEYLELKRHMFWRQNTVGVWDATRKQHRKQRKYSRNGVADIILLKNGKSYFLEVKDKSPQSKTQKEFEVDVKKAGCEYHIVRSVDDIIKLGL